MEVSESANALLQVWHGKNPLIDGALGSITNIVKYYEEQLMKEYCEQVVSDVAATLFVDQYDNGQRWHHYGVRIDGRMTLRYEKSAATGDTYPLTGAIEGNATGYESSTDVTIVESLPQSMLLLEAFDVTPVPFADTSSDIFGFGLFARMATPSYFYLPVQAEVQGDQLAVNILDPLVDRVGGNSIAVVIAMAPPLPVPLIKTFDIPIQDAEFILTRGMYQPAEFTLGTWDSKTVVEGDFDRHEELDEVDVDFRVRVTAAQ